MYRAASNKNSSSFPKSYSFLNTKQRKASETMWSFM